MTLAKMLVGESLRSVLDRLAALPGVALAVLVDREGFLIESAGGLGCGDDVPAAWMACLAQSCDGIGRELGKEAFRSMVVEYEIGSVFLEQLDDAVMLAVLMRDSAGLGQLRAHLRDAVPELLAAL